MAVAPDFFEGVRNCGYVSDVDGCSTLDGYDGVPDLVEVLKLTECPQQIFGVASRNVPAGKVQVFVTQLGDYLL